MSVERVNATHMTVSWTAPSPVEARGHIIHYAVYYWPASSGEQVVNITVPHNTTSVEIGGLLPGETYTVQVSASTSVGEGSKSEEMTASSIQQG